MGSKIEARALMQRAGVPVVPGEAPDSQADTALVAAIDRVGIPALLKPSSGGGGIGMQIVRRKEDAAAAIQAARRNAEAAFGDGTLYVERLVERPRHIEIQIFADDHEQVVSLFERECSLQRRHQKVIEESPSPALTPELRAAMGEAAVAAARACGYRNAGTIEFLLDESSGSPVFYFMEMNTRLQVEHPVTEQVVGVDLVRAQLLVAAGQPLPWRADQLRQRGHAIECRVYAEHPAEGFLPQSGPLLLYREPAGPGVRVDSGVREGGNVSVHYDPLVAKLIVSAETPGARAGADGPRVVRVRRPRHPYQCALPSRAGESPRGSRGTPRHALHRADAGRARGGHPRRCAARRSRGGSAPGGGARPASQGTSTVERPDPWRSLTGWRN